MSTVLHQVMPVCGRPWQPTVQTSQMSAVGKAWLIHGYENLWNHLLYLMLREQQCYKVMALTTLVVLLTQFAVRSSFSAVCSIVWRVCFWREGFQRRESEGRAQTCCDVSSNWFGVCVFLCELWVISEKGQQRVTVLEYKEKRRNGERE